MQFLGDYIVQHLASIQNYFKRCHLEHFWISSAPHCSHFLWTLCERESFSSLPVVSGAPELQAGSSVICRADSPSQTKPNQSFPPEAGWQYKPWQYWIIEVPSILNLQSHRTESVFFQVNFSPLSQAVHKMSRDLRSKTLFQTLQYTSWNTKR